MNEKEIVWGMIQENFTQRRHHENQRAKITGLFVAISAGIIGLISFDNKLTAEDLPLSIFLIIIGLFGSLFNAREYDRYLLHRERTNELFKHLHEVMPNFDIMAIKKVADKRSGEISSRFIRKYIKLHTLWNYFQVFISLLGIWISICILSRTLF